MGANNTDGSRAGRRDGAEGAFSAVHLEEGALALGGILLGLASSPTWREAAAAAASFCAAFALRSRALCNLAFGFGYAVLAAAAVAQGSAVSRVAVPILAGVALLGILIRRGTWPKGLVAATIIGGLLAAVLPAATSYLAVQPVSRAAGLARWPALAASFAAALLIWSRGRPQPGPRWLLGLGLALAAALGFGRLALATSELARARVDPRHLQSAISAARRAGYSSGEREARVRQARELIDSNQPARALEFLPPNVALGAQALSTRADALLATGELSRAMNVLRKALESWEGERLEVSAEALGRLGLWKARRGYKDASSDLTRAAGAREGERYLIEAAALLKRGGRVSEAEWLLTRAVQMSPLNPSVICANAEAEPISLDRARSCLEKVPLHLPSLRALASEGDPSAADSLARLGGPPLGEVLFGGTFKEVGVRVEPVQATVGETVRVDVALELVSTLAPGERYQLVALLSAPGTPEANMKLLSQPAWVRGEAILGHAEVAIPPGTLPGRMAVHLSIVTPEMEARLNPWGILEHVKSIEVGALEVKP